MIISAPAMMINTRSDQRTAQLRLEGIIIHQPTRRTVMQFM
jgi:hypothetical protein